MIGPALKRQIEQTFHVIKDKSSDEELVFLCPECGDKSGHRAVNLKSGLTFCWKCNKGRNNKGGFLAWARALGHEFSGNDYSLVPVESVWEDDTPNTKMPVVKTVPLPRGFAQIAHEPDDVYTRLISRMARKKRLDYDDFAKAQVGFTRIGKWEPYAIFPVYDYSTVVYYQGRTYADPPKGEPTKLFPNRKEVPFGAGYWVYNIDEVRRAKPRVVVIVESILNVLSLKRKFKEEKLSQVVPVCVFKHSVSKVQATKILQCEGVEELCFLFDRDAIDMTWRMVGRLTNKASVTIAEMPYQEGKPHLDANDDVDAALEAILNAKPYKVIDATEHFIDSLVERKVDITGVRIRS
jgi:hypothetical protein